MFVKRLTSNRTVKGILTLIGTITVGAIGSGVWEATKPLLISSRDVILDTMSFLSSSYKDAAYAEIAQGIHEDNSTRVYIRITLIVMFVLVGGISSIFLKFLEYNRNRKETLKDIEDILLRIDQPQVDNQKQPETLPQEQDIRTKVLTLRESVLKQFPLRDRVLMYSLFIWSVLLWLYLITDNSRISYISSAVTHFRQVYSISAPYMNEEQRLQTISRFSQIKTSQDYTSILQNISKIATDNRQYVPDFDIW